MCRGSLKAIDRKLEEMQERRSKQLKHTGIAADELAGLGNAGHAQAQVVRPASTKNNKRAPRSRILKPPRSGEALTTSDESSVLLISGCQDNQLPGRHVQRPVLAS
jgi:hypothetical protein